MRQVGVMACMGLYALENNVHRLHYDHKRAKKLEDGLRSMGFYIKEVDEDVVKTNIVFFGLPPSTTDCKNDINMDDVCYKLAKEYGVEIGSGYGNHRQKLFRAVVHMDIDDDDIDRALDALYKVCCRR